MVGKAILKKFLGEAGALSDISGGYAGGTLYEVLKAALANGQTLSTRQAVVATGIIAKMVITQSTVLRDFGLCLEVAGTAGQTVVEVRKTVGAGAATVVSTLTIPNTATDPYVQVVHGINVSFNEGDVVDFNVQTAPTGGTGLTMTANFTPVDIE